MTIKEELENDCEGIFRSQWKLRVGQQIPTPENLGLGNEAVEIDAVVLYADIAESTALVDTKDWQFAGEVYKSFLRCSARLIKHHGGEITAYDGDRVMGIFIGNGKNTSAMKAALRINWANIHVISPKMKQVYSNSQYVMRHTVGIDSSIIRAARTGVRGANDIVWIGPSANWAAKLCDVNKSYSSWITEKVHSAAAAEAKVWTDGSQMWERCLWGEKNNLPLYRSNWWMAP